MEIEELIAIVIFQVDSIIKAETKIVMQMLVAVVIYFVDKKLNPTILLHIEKKTNELKFLINE